MRAMDNISTEKGDIASLHHCGDLTPRIFRCNGPQAVERHVIMADILGVTIDRFILCASDKPDTAIFLINIV